jgi:fructoselysine-6-P-deglycase FrlB-like protein
MPTTRIPFADALATQAEQLAAVRASVTDSIESMDLPQLGPDDTVAVVAMGASRNAGNALVAVLAEAGRRAVDLTASEVLIGPPGYQPGDHYVIVSESGRSPEPLEAAGRLTPGRRIGVSNFPDAQIGEVVDRCVDLGGVPDSPVYSVGYTGTLLAFGYLAERWGVKDASAGLADIETTIPQHEASFQPLLDAVGSLLGGADSVDFVASGVSFATATEFALMVREALRVPATALETYEFLHGPMESAFENSLVVLFGDDRELTVPGPLLDAGVPVILVTTRAAAEVPRADHQLLTVVEIGSELRGFARAIVETVFAQRALEASATHKPFPVEEFRFSGLGTKLDEETHGD